MYEGIASFRHIHTAWERMKGIAKYMGFYRSINRGANWHNTYIVSDNMD